MNRNSSKLTEIITFKINCVYFEINIGRIKKKPFYHIDYRLTCQCENKTHHKKGRMKKVWLYHSIIVGRKNAFVSGKPMMMEQVVNVNGVHEKGCIQT